MTSKNRIVRLYDCPCGIINSFFPVNVQTRALRHVLAAAAAAKQQQQKQQQDLFDAHEPPPDAANYVLTRYNGSLVGTVRTIPLCTHAPTHATRTHTRTHAPTHARKHTHAHAHTRTHTRARTHTHTHLLRTSQVHIIESLFFNLMVLFMYT
jgi:hypothetical protein